MKQIILTQQQYDLIMSYRNQFIEILRSRNVDIAPVKLISGDYILPEKILTDGAYTDLIPQIQGLGEVTYREISESEIDKTSWI